MSLLRGLRDHGPLDFLGRPTKSRKFLLDLIFMHAIYKYQVYATLDKQGILCMAWPSKRKTLSDSVGILSVKDHENWALLIRIV